MKKLIIAAAVAVTSLVPALAFAYPMTPRTVAVHSSAGARSYLRRAPGTANGARVIVRSSVRNNASGSQSLVRSHVRSAPVSAAAAN